jgi:hypothetical protein
MPMAIYKYLSVTAIAVDMTTFAVFLYGKILLRGNDLFESLAGFHDQNNSQQ